MKGPKKTNRNMQRKVLRQNRNKDEEKGPSKIKKIAFELEEEKKPEHYKRTTRKKAHPEQH